MIVDAATPVPSLIECADCGVDVAPETTMADLLDISALDPDYRRDPKTELFCRICQRDIKNEATAKWIYEVAGGNSFCTVEDTPTHEGGAGDLGMQPVGPECSRKVPAAYLHDSPGSRSGRYEPPRTYPQRLSAET